MKKIVPMIVALQMLILPGAVFAQNTAVEVPQPEKNINSTPLNGDPGRQAQNSANALNPSTNLQTVNGGSTDYAVISNESTDSVSSQPTGTFNLKNMKLSMDKILKPSTYKVDVTIPFDLSSMKGSLVRKSTSLLVQPYKVGDSKLFWVSNLTTNSDYQINARLAYIGTKAEVWVNNNQLSDADAAKLGMEFDNKIYSTVTANFGTESDVNKDGKINILCYDIQDGFSGSGGYVAGYFYPGDLYITAHSNQSETFYIDTYPTMGTGSVKDVSGVYSTLAHEFQHMVNYNQNVLVEGNSSMDTWLDEGLAMAAEQIYMGHGLTDRLAYYNESSAIQNGQSLLYWDESGDLLSNYSLSYLFTQYIKIQANQGDRIFKEILQDPNNNYKAIEDVAKKYISPAMTFGKLMTDFRIALLLKQPTGLYGFKGDPFFNSLQAKVYTGTSVSLHGGGSVVTAFNPNDGLAVPLDKGQNITYTLLDMNNRAGTVVTVPPASPKVNPVGDADTQLKGTAAPNATVVAMAGKTEIGRVNSGTGAFTITIPKQLVGTIIQVYAKDALGNVSTATSVTVKGTVKRGWVFEKGNWFYYDLKTGVMKTGWVYTGGHWYYLAGSGAMKTGWIMWGGKWYFLNRSGAMETGWKLINNKWYYFYSNGSMAANTTIGKYKLGWNGAML
ncbi:Ig-like domain-containing protein [Neobacillus ginsengisoli]|uniref:Bacterial Ig domain-containing protein n=1 Tax=Neobacillus ginsengisoli TaxID=904295 RepID=A0ABT9XUK2_9BACI|nr:Ig-like domain-containing protein [Neobacillus ginsengisoli]MDQ0199194.1 hypothetical protein [Neobacillus ginsengisoli]